MALQPGTRLGHYEILSPIGAGGMGAVYKARDTRLGRSVAIKVLHPDAATDEARRVRFEREARAVSALAHPHICPLFDIGRADGVDYLVMEHVDGESLDVRVKRGPMPVTEALLYASQIAAALHEAHRAGIVHRDLKPANVIVARGGARLLDFGLARLHEPAPAGAAEPTASVLTASQTLVGTVPYMAPEQLLGREADARSDIFAFGALLFELLTGRRPFAGESNAAVMAAILEREPPPLRTILPQAPASLEVFLQHCLAKSPDSRWQSARDLELALAGIRAGLHDRAATSAASASGRRRFAAVAALVAIAATGTLGGVWIGRWSRAAPAPAGSRPVAFEIPLPDGEWIHEHNSSSIVFAPDGRTLAYAANRRDARGLYLRSLDRSSAEWVAAGERVASPFFSPDGRWIAFESGGWLKKVQRDGGQPTLLCETPYFAGGGWAPDGSIVLTPSVTGGLFRVSGNGGTPERLTRPKDGERGHMWPQVLADGRVLFTVWTGGSFDQARLALLDPATNAHTTILEGGYHGRYAHGRVVFVRGSRLLSAPFDFRAGRISGDTQVLADGIAGDAGSGSSLFTVSEDGSLAYVHGQARTLPRAMVLVSSAGSTLSTQADNRAINSARFSPDGRRIAFWIEEAVTAVWLKDVDRDPLTRLTFSGDDHGPVWSPDGRWIAFESGRASMHQVFVRASDGSGGDRQVTSGEYHHYLNDWSPDGRWLIYVEFHPQTNADLWIVNAEGTPAPRPFRATEFSQRFATFSPDSQWIAYTSNETGRNEVYVQRTSGGDRIAVSTGGGEEPAWSRAGDLLYFRAGTAMMQVPLTKKDGRLEAGRAAVLFRGQSYHYNLLPSRSYDVAPDGRFVMVTTPDAAGAPRRIEVQLNRLR